MSGSTKSTRDLTTGSETKTIILFAIPIMLETLFNTLYNMSDKWVLGNFVGVNELASLVTSSFVIYILSIFSTGFIQGFRILLGQLFGAKDTEGYNKASVSMVCAVFLFNFVFIGLSLLAARPLLLLMDTPRELLKDATLYLSIYISGMFFQNLSSALGSVILASGNSRVPMLISIGANAVNIVLDVLLVAFFGMGLFGVALTTALAMLISAVATLIYLVKKRPELIAYARKNLHIDREMLRRGVSLAIPTALQRSSSMIAAALMNRLSNSFGALFIAGLNAATTGPDYYAMLFSVSFGSALSVFASQNKGAGRPERVRRGYRNIALIQGAISVLSGVVIFLFAGQLVGFFVDSSKEGAAQMVSYGVQYLHVVTPFYLLVGMQQITLGVLRGVGDVKYTMTVSMTAMALRLVFAYSLVYFTAADYRALYWSVPLTWALIAVPAVIRFVSGRWEKGKRVKEKVQTS